MPLPILRVMKCGCSRDFAVDERLELLRFSGYSAITIVRQLAHPNYKKECDEILACLRNLVQKCSIEHGSTEKILCDKCTSDLYFATFEATQLSSQDGLCMFAYNLHTIYKTLEMLKGCYCASPSTYKRTEYDLVDEMAKLCNKATF